MTDRTGLRQDGPQTAQRQHHQPVRTCVGCRASDSRSALLRVVLGSRTVDSSASPAVVLVPDPSRRAEGRGAWLHPTPECFEHAVRRRAFGRALRSSATPDPAGLTAYLEGLWQKPSE